jgi:tetratricopeptide (TPR) repeat protein
VRRLSTSRHDSLDWPMLEGFDQPTLEGDRVGLAPDGITALRPFGRDFPEPALGLDRNSDLPADQWVVARAALLGRSGRRLEAVQLLRHFLVDSPQSEAPRLLLVDLLEPEDPDGAANEISKAVEASPTPAIHLARRGSLYARLGQAALAERDFREAIRRDPSYGLAYRYLGIARLRLGRPGEAVGILREALERAPDEPEATLHLGEALAASGEAEEALGILQRAAALCPADPRSYTLLGRLLDRLGRTDEAMEMHRKAREVATA